MVSFAAHAQPRVSWLGNTFGDGVKSVQNNVAALAVAADGTCYTNSFWDEAGHESTIYANGDILGACVDTHTHGGFAVATDGTYIYLACTTTDRRTGVRRYDLTGKPAPILNGDKLAGFIALPHSPRGLTLLRGELLAGDYEGNLVHRITTGDLVEVKSFPVESPQRLAAAPDGTLWVVSGNPARVAHLRGDGSPLPEKIEGLDPAALAFDPAGRLLVADNGPDQQVKTFDVTADPKLIATLGEKGGVYAGRRGETGPLKFNGLTGVGADAAGNIYVSHNGLGPAFRDHPGFGAEIKCFSPEGKRVWGVEGLEFVDSARVDPGSDIDAYTSHQHFKLDYSATDPGKEATYRGFTIDRGRFPGDPRLHLSAECVLGVRRLHGHRYLYLSDMYARFVIVYRLEGESEIAVPCAMFSREHLKENWPPEQPKEGAWLWRDLDGDGQISALEFEGNPADNPFAWGWSVDDSGTVWKALRESGLRRFPLQGVDVSGTPIYHYADSTVEANPFPFIESRAYKGDINRVEYDAPHDVMYLAGYTPRHPNKPEQWGQVGTVICRYDGWSKGKRDPTWQIELPYDASAKEKILPKAMAFAGDRLFVAYLQQPRIVVFDAKTGKQTDALGPGMPVGWCDTPYGISAHRRINGEYVLFAEEDLNARILLYRWK